MLADQYDRRFGIRAERVVAIRLPHIVRLQIPRVCLLLYKGQAWLIAANLRPLRPAAVTQY